MNTKQEMVEFLGEVAALMAKVEAWQEAGPRDHMLAVGLAGLQTAYRAISHTLAVQEQAEEAR
jgi:hypothetical protein